MSWAEAPLALGGRVLHANRAERPDAVLAHGLCFEMRDLIVGLLSAGSTYVPTFPLGGGDEIAPGLG
jgi:hypothetical protein